MKIISHQKNITSSIRITLSFAILITQFLIPISNNCIAANSSEPGVVQTPEIQEMNQPIMLPFLPGDAILLNAYPDTSSFLNGVYPIDSQGNIEFPMGERIIFLE